PNGYFRKPLLLLLPVLCQRNLFSLLLTVQSTVPEACLQHLLQASRQDPSPDLWVQRLRDLLQVRVQENSSVMPVLLSDSCRQQLKYICQKVSCGKPGLEKKLSWCAKQASPYIAWTGDAPGSMPQIRENKEVLSGGIAPPELQVFNECTPSQVILCSLLQLSECPENKLLHFCTWLVALSPDLGYSNAAVLAEKLFLPRVLLLTEPPSWPLTTALMMFCSKYSRPVCCTLISSIIQAPAKGELILPELLHIIEMPWSEDLLVAVHSLLGRQVVLSTELFNMLVLNLCQMAQEFATSMHYANLVLTVLTKYQSSVSYLQQALEKK
uniref:Fanconi Anaemia group E protein C-terminal domain-containing protein n=1 Tax=Podarcis muralis TaxID=64176 RepID=A0A670J9L7_PODMU